MNFIKHFLGLMDRIAVDERLTPHHVSLYVTLFHLWNLNHFRNPVSIARSEMMHLSKIGSVNTYLRCLKELSQWGYLRYEPSFNAMRGSKVYLYRFDTGVDTAGNTSREPLTIQVVRPSTNSLNTTNHENIAYLGEQATGTENIKVFSKDKQGTPGHELPAKPDAPKEKVAPKRKDNSAKLKGTSAKPKKLFAPPVLGEVETYFQFHQYPAVEAQKFYNYFQSNGWKVGGRAPMQDWQAAARNWMLNIKPISHENAQRSHPANATTRANHLHTTTDKDYGEPL